MHGLVAENAALRVAVDGVNSELYGKGFEVLGWHLNGDTEPLDTWFEDNDWDPETPATEAAVAEIESVGAEKMFNLVEPAVRNFSNPQVTRLVLEELAILATDLRAGRKG